MQESTKPAEPDETIEDPSEERSEREAFHDEQMKHSYYYDDAHGYETYRPEDDEPQADVSTAADGDTTPS